MYLVYLEKMWRFFSYLKQLRYNVLKRSEYLFFNYLKTLL